MRHEAILRFAPIFTLERFNDPAWTRPDRTMYERGALRFLPGKESVPLLVDHDEERAVGVVRSLGIIDWTAGEWAYASATINDAPSWLKQGTRVSFGFEQLHRRELDIAGVTADVIADAIVTEVSILSPATKPAEPCAQVQVLTRCSPAAGPLSR